MSFKIPSADEIQKIKEKSDYQVPSLFKAARVSAGEQKRLTRSSSSTTQGACAPDSVSSDNHAPNQSGLCCISSNVELSCSKNTVDNISEVQSDSDTADKLKTLPEVVDTNQRQQNRNVVVESASTSSKGVVLRPVKEPDGSLTLVRQPKANSIVVSPKQRGNPILKFIRNVPWEFGDIVPDYQCNPTTCVLFLSVRYHNLKPNYIHERLRQLANSYVLRILLVQVDVKDCDYALKELAKICILADCTMVLAFTAEEAGRYIETYKSFESKPADMLMEKTDNNYMAKMTDTLTSVKKINKTDAATLISAFGSFKKIAEASEQDLSLCPGMGPQKASRLRNVFNQPFLK